MDSPVPAVASDFTSGSGPLRLVRLRLVLSLIAMAILPLAIAAPLAYSIVDGQQATERLRAERDASAVASAIGTRLDRTEQAVVRAAASPILTGLLASPARTSVTTARASLLILGSATDDGIREAAIVDAEGQVRLWIVGGKPTSAAGRTEDDDILADTLALGSNSDVAYESTVHPDSAGGPSMTIAAPIAAFDNAGDPVGILRIELSISQLVGSGTSGLVGGSILAQLVDTSGSILTQARGTGQAVPADGTRATAGVPGFPDWRIQITEPRQSASTPVVLLGGLALVVFLLAGLPLWMARQVLHPAEQLEASRRRLRELYEHARLDALSDVLTGLGNHRAFHEEFDRQLETARRYDTALSLVLIDLDDFKLVNDTAGHAAGDELLAEMGRLVSMTIRTVDRAFRIGGDEFAILMPQTEADGARVLGRRLLAFALENRPGSSMPGSFSFSIGISAYPALAADRRLLYSQADAALYWSKTHGRTMVQIFDPDRHHDHGVTGSSISQLGALVAELSATRAVRAVYQPIIELATGRIMGYEGLVRPSPESGFSDAGALFVAAEASGRQAELDQICLEVVIGGAARLAPDSLLSLNLSPRTLEVAEFSVPGVVRLLERHGISANRVIFELTEREDVDDVGRLRQNVAACRAAGIRIAADDVGAGNAGLRLLSQMQFDIVKIDLSLVQDGLQRKTSLAVISSLQELAQRWGAWVIAEGVETPDQLDMIRGLGISAAQGYLLGRPGDSVELGPVDMSALLTPDDWLHKLARTPRTLNPQPSQSA